MSPEHIRIAELAKEDKERKFSSIAHLLTVEALHEAFKELRKDASAGVDGVTAAEYATEVRKNLEQLHDRLKSGNRKLRGHYQYYGRSTNLRSLLKFHEKVRKIWHKWLNRRSRGNHLNWSLTISFFGGIRY